MSMFSNYKTESEKFIKTSYEVAKVQAEDKPTAVRFMKFFLQDNDKQFIANF